ncbi:hypothetical protein F2Q68_00000681 [Brassica cretica]|uniref:Mechanosensitive ion channel MscS domain-containing protein n=1 Tax=Brassica cretica TaxID=69181 RepID=A0A8S9J8P9_BRACR|nr:hypothetical protein F2Q68_00000681 [Brassica cretica]
MAERKITNGGDIVINVPEKQVSKDAAASPSSNAAASPKPNPGTVKLEPLIIPQPEIYKLSGSIHKPPKTPSPNTKGLTRRRSVYSKSNSRFGQQQSYRYDKTIVEENGGTSPKEHFGMAERKITNGGDIVINVPEKQVSKDAAASPSSNAAASPKPNPGTVKLEPLSIPQPEIYKLSGSIHKPPKTPSPNTKGLTRRRSVYSKSNSRFGQQQSYRYDKTIVEENGGTSPKEHFGAASFSRASFNRASQSNRSNRSISSVLSKVSEDEADENEEIYKKVKLHQGKRSVMNPLALLELLIFFAILCLLVVSLTIDTVKEHCIWGLEVWKWCVLVMVTLSGMFVTNWFMHIVVFIIERNYLLRKKINVYTSRKALGHSLNDTKTAVRQVDKLITGVMSVITFIVWLVLLDIATTKFLLVFSTQFVGLAFMIGSTCKNIFESFVFVFVMHPYDVGDRCVIDGIILLVEEIHLLTTVFLKIDNEKVFYPNATLVSKPISNFYRSPDMGDAVEFSIAFSTPAAKIATLKEKIAEYLVQNPHNWYPEPLLMVKAIENVNKLNLNVLFQHTINFQNFAEKNLRRTEMVITLKRILEELEIDYTLLPQQVHLTGQK